MAVLADFFQGGGFAEAGDVLVDIWIPAFAGMTVEGFTAPEVVGVGDLLNIGITELSPGAVHQGAHVAGVDEQHFAAPVAQGLFAALAVRLVAGQEPQAGGDLGGVEQLAGQGHHAVHGVGLDHSFADLAFAALVGAHGAVGQYHPGSAEGREVPVDVLQPGVVGVAYRWHAELPARVFTQAVTAPVGNIKRRIGENIIKAQVAQLVLVEAALVVPADIGVDAAHGEVHFGQAPGGVVALLSVDGDVADAPAVFQHECFALHEHADAAAAVVVDTAPIVLEHLNQYPHYRLRGVELTAALAFGTGELAEEVFINAAEHVF